MQANKVNLKVVLLGDSGVGKSSIILRFVADNFKADADATIGAAYMGKIMQFSGKSIKFNIWDTAGQERFHTLAKMYYRDANAAIIVYDITKADSFEGLKRWYEELSQNGPRDLVKLIIGNKEDLVATEVVSPTEVAAYAKSIGAVFKKTSAKTSTGVESVFREVAGIMFPEPGADEPRQRVGAITVKKDKKDSSEKPKRGWC